MRDAWRGLDRLCGGYWMRRDVERQTSQASADIANMRFLTEGGDEISPAGWHGSPVLLVFLRWLG